MICDLLVPCKRQFPSLSVPLGLSSPQQQLSPSSLDLQGAHCPASAPFSYALHRSDGAEPYPFLALTRWYLSLCLSRGLLIVPPRQGTLRAVRRARSSTLTCGGEPALTRDKHDMHDMKE